MYAELVDHLEQAQTDVQLRCVILCGEGPDFTGGHDLKDFISSPPSDEHSPVLRFINLLAEFEKPLIAKVRGHAIGIGTTLLLHFLLQLHDFHLHFQVLDITLVQLRINITW